MTEDFTQRLLLKGISEEEIAQLPKPMNYVSLCKLAIDYSDGVVQMSEHVNEEVLEYARQSGKLMLDYQAEEEGRADACNDFYDKVW